jgi:hypothetical protein
VIRVVALLLCTVALRAAGPVYVALWFDTEDYLSPASDDAALRIATDLTQLGVHATFKVVGEKARVLEVRGRRDVLRALSKHSIGYHSNLHSVHPTPSEYLRHLGYLEGADEFQRREEPGALDIRRVFGTSPSCYGQPGSSWGPQSNLALRRMRIPVYLDEGSQVGLDGQPFWYGGLLYVFNMGEQTFRARLDAGAEDTAAYATFDKVAAKLRAQGGGLISIYYHPTEFVNTEFWDAVNFSHGANPPREQWKPPHARTKEDSERCYRVLQKFVEHMKSSPDVRFVTAKDLLVLYKRPLPGRVDHRKIAEHLRSGITFLTIGNESLSPADMLLQLLGIEPQIVDGPTMRAATTLRARTINREVLQTAAQDAAEFIRRNHRLPNQVFIGPESLALPDFTATLAAALLSSSDSIPVTSRRLVFEKYFATDAAKSFNWVIHPEGFSAPELLELGKLQGWTLKPAQLVPARKQGS